MRNEFKLQDPGEGVQEVEILELMVVEGDEISEGQEVMAVESDKAAIELPSPFTGTVAEIRVSEGETVSVGHVLMVVTDGDDEADDTTDTTTGAEETEDDETAQDKSEADPETEKAEADSEEAVKEKEPQQEDAEDEQPRAIDAKRQKADSPETGQSEETEPLRASPAARRLASEEGIDLADIKPSGKEGQVTVDDVRKARSDAEDKSAKASEVSETDEFGPVEREKISAIRAATARTMIRSWTEIPHVTHEDMADITDLELWRRRQTEESRLSLTPIVAKSVVAVLKNYPRFNATYDAEADEIVLRNYWNINIAIDTNRGLVTPTLKDADRRSARELAEEIVSLAGKARDRKLTKTDTSGGTFTITNVGSVGGRGLTPLINPPQSAILGLGRARIEPVTTADIGTDGSTTVKPRMMLPLALSFDHRVSDGADAARFMNELVTILNDPVSLALET